MASTPDLLELTKQLIRFRSTANRPDQLLACADFIADFFSDTVLQVKIIDSNGIPSVLVTRAHANPEILLAGHFDVVEGDDAQFNPHVTADNYLHGRGAFDMKSGVAAQMFIMKELADSDNNLGLLLTGDEENGGFNGSGYVVEKYNLRPKVVLLPDGGNKINNIVEKEKGLLRIMFKAQGVAAHGSRPWSGVNAIELLMNSLDRIKNSLFNKIDRDNWHNTFNIGTIQGGTAVNAVPAFAEAHCDIRTIEDTNHNECVAELQKILPPEVGMETTFAVPAVRLPRDSFAALIYLDCLRQLGYEPAFVSTHGASDSRFFAARGSVVLMSQPSGYDHHGAEERVAVDTIEKYYQLLKLFIGNFSQPVINAPTTTTTTTG